jgi:ElaB/YqjD/DUF883 family membrane-anchored ribosome-binding protein
MATDGELTLLRDMLSRLDQTLRDHIRDTQEARQRTASELAQLNDALVDLKLWKAKVVGISGFVAFLASFLSEWLKSLISARGPGTP